MKFKRGPNIELRWQRTQQERKARRRSIRRLRRSLMSQAAKIGSAFPSSQ